MPKIKDILDLVKQRRIYILAIPIVNILFKLDLALNSNLKDIFPVHAYIHYLKFPCI